MTDFPSVVDDIEPAFRRLVQSDPFRLDHKPSPVPKGRAGVYCLYGSDHRPLYVGRGRDVRQRLANHRSTSVTSASLAVKMARIEAQKPAHYKRETSPDYLLAHCQAFADAFARALARIRDMQVRYVELGGEDNGVHQAVLEMYAACKLGTLINCGGYNTFETS